MQIGDLVVENFSVAMVDSRQPKDHGQALFPKCSLHIMAERVL